MNFQGQSVLSAILTAAALAIAYPATSGAAVIDISAGPNGWGCSQCSGPQNVLPGTVVNLVNAGESGPLQLTLGAGSYTITNAATTGNYSAWNFEGYPSSGNWVWSFLIGADHGNGTATVLNDDYIAGIFSTQAAAAGATTTTWDGNNQLPGTTTAAFIDTLNLSTTTTLDFFIDDYYLGDNGGGVALNISTNSTSAPEPSTLALLGAGLAGLGFLRRKRS
jgi:PEP-CTERM motif